MELFQRPALAREAGGEIVEQLGMAGLFALCAEVAGRANQTGAEVMGPDTIDDHPRGERIIRARDGVCQFQAGLVREYCGIAPAEDLKGLRSSHRAQVVPAATNPDALLLP